MWVSAVCAISAARLRWSSERNVTSAQALLLLRRCIPLLLLVRPFLAFQQQPREQPLLLLLLSSVTQVSGTV